MIPFITYREQFGGDLQYFILQKGYPHYNAMVVDNPNFVAAFKMPIPHTTLYVALQGTIQGRLIPSYINVDKEIQDVLERMAVWYYENRIINNEKKYKKWLLKAAQTT